MDNDTPQDDDLWVSARSVISDTTRLAFDGYRLVDSDTENILGLTMQLMDGQREINRWPNVFQAVRNRPGEIAKDRARPLLNAVVQFLNAGGDPEDISSMVPSTCCLPKIEYKDFELAGVYETVEREVYYITKDDRVIRVFPGIMSEEVSEEELNEEDDEEGPSEDDETA